jgi:CHAD domain-containing protein
MEYAPDPGYSLFGAEALLKRLQALTQEIGGARQAEDVECIHRMRVASRRLRAALDLFKDTLPRKKISGWEKQIKRITRAFGAVRDTDVGIAALDDCLSRLTGRGRRPGIVRLRLRLHQRRARQRSDVLKLLDGWDAGGIADDMGQTLRRMLVRGQLSRVPAVSDPVLQLAHSHILLRLEEFLSYEYFVARPERVEELHAMRIAAKRLRYTLEIFAPLDEDGFKEPLKSVRDAQELLGDIHDGDVWAQALPQFIQEERGRMIEYMGSARAFGRLALGLRCFQRDRRRRRDQRYRDFVRFWKESQERDVWGRLRRSAQAGPVPVEPPPEPSSPAGPENGS